MTIFANPTRIADISECFFYHKMDLPEFGTVGGSWDLRGRFDDYVDNVDLAGKSVLDIGTAGGFLTFEAENRGAHVVSFDMDDKSRQHYLPYRGQIWYENKEAYDETLNAGYQRWKNGYWLAHRALKSNARVFYGNIYELPRDIGNFDVVIVGCIFMHLANPIIALESISRVAADKIIIVDTVDVNEQDRYAHLESKASDPSGHFIWWVYSVGLYREVLTMLGYDLIKVSQKFYTCNDYSDEHGREKSSEVMLTTLTAERKR